MARLSRTQRRVSYRARVSLAEPGGQLRIAGQALNLSVAGMFVHAAGSCPLGSDVVCDMPLPSGMCQVKGRVTRIQRLPDATGMAIQFVDLPEYQQAMLNELIDRSREPSIPLAVRFEGMMTPIQCRGVFFDDKLRLRTKLPFLRVGSNVQVSVDSQHPQLPASADLTGTLASVALRPSPVDGIPRLSIDLDVGRSESDEEIPLGPTPLEQAIATCVAQAAKTNTPTPEPERLDDKTTRPLAFERPPSVMVSGELSGRPRTRTEEVAAPANDDAAAVPARTDATIDATTAEPPLSDGDGALAPDPRASDEWAETEAIPTAARRAPAAAQAAAPPTAVPARPSHGRLLALLGLGAFGLLLGLVLLRGSASTSRRITAKMPAPRLAPGAVTAHPPVAQTATAAVAPTIVSLPAPTAGPLAPAVQPAKAATPAVGRAPAPAHRVIHRPRPPAPLAFDPATKQYRLSGVTQLDLGGARLTGVTGLAGVPTANVRGIDVAVAPGATSMHVTFPDPEADGAYGITVSPSWPTTAAVSEKTPRGFTVTFAAPAPEAATFDWLLVH